MSTRHVEFDGREPRARAGRVSVYPPLFLGVGLFVVIRSFPLLSPILLSLLLIVLVSLALNPVVARMRALTGGRKPATVVLAVLLLMVVASIGLVSLRPMMESARRLSEALPDYWSRLRKPLLRFQEQARQSDEQMRKEVSAEPGRADAQGGPTTAPATPVAPVVPAAPAAPAASAPPSLSGLGDVLKQAVGPFSAVAFNAAQILMVIVTVFFGVTFTLMNPGPIWVSVFAWVPESHHGKALAVAKRIAAFAPGWALSTLMGMLSIGILVTLLLWPVFGFTDALVLGLFAGLMEAVPFVGPLLSAVPALLLAAGKGGLTPVWVVLIYVLVQALENNVILPFVMARGMRLHPVAVMIATLLSVAAFGVLGVLVAAPLVAVLRICYDELYRDRFLPTTSDLQLKQLSERALQVGVVRKG